MTARLKSFQTITETKKMRDREIGLRSYQDIITPEEQEERNRAFWERQRKEREKAEYLADIARDEEHEENEE